MGRAALIIRAWPRAIGRYDGTRASTRRDGDGVRISLLWLGLVCAPLILADSAFAQGSAQKRVIVFNALRKDSPVPLSLDRDLQRIIGGGLSGGLDYYSESIDVARFPDDDYQVALREFLARSTTDGDSIW